MYSLLLTTRNIFVFFFRLRVCFFDAVFFSALYFVCLSYSVFCSLAVLFLTYVPFFHPPRFHFTLACLPTNGLCLFFFHLSAVVALCCCPRCCKKMWKKDRTEKKNGRGKYIARNGKPQMWQQHRTIFAPLK